MTSSPRVCPEHGDPMLIDVDTGVDDAIALALAVELGIHVVGVSTVAGNVPVGLSTQNTIDVLTWLGATTVPVHRGASRPLVASYQDATHVHGGNGLGGASLPPGTIREHDTPGPASIIEAADAYARSLTIVTLGPLTNLAIALNVRPEIVSRIRRVVVMGGAFFAAGNVTPHAEFNVYADPEAADQVFNAGFGDLTLVGLDVTHQTALARDAWERIDSEAVGGPGLIRKVLDRTFTERAMNGFFLHDPLALAVAVDPTLIKGERYRISVVTGGEERGKTVTAAGAGGPLVARSVDAERFVSMAMSHLKLTGSSTLPHFENVD